LTTCSFQLLFGKVYTVFPIRATLLTSIALFEIASVICGAAPNSLAFILGRAIAGVGAAGIFSGTVGFLPSQLSCQQASKLTCFCRSYASFMLCHWKSVP
jgi:MFS family permease